VTGKRRLRDLEQIADILAERALRSLSDAQARLEELRHRAATLEEHRRRLAEDADVGTAARHAASYGALRARQAEANRDLAAWEARTAELRRDARRAVGRLEAVRALRGGDRKTRGTKGR
jgi:chromosome segregation ATPase